jgi:curved DNA-binding protein CbpA
MDYKKNYYSILGVDEKASHEALRDSYRRLAKLHHPDKNPGDPGAEERFKAINEAYEILSNEITRHIYDSHRTTYTKENQSQRSKGDKDINHTHKPYTTTKTRTYTVKREKRIYVHGVIEVKFQGEPELSDTYTRQWEQRFRIIPTEILATITSSAIYKDGPPKEYQLGYSSAELFATPLKQPVNCRIITGDIEEYYQLDIYEIRVKDPKLKDITRHDQYSFGTLEGTLFGYVVKIYEEEVTEEYTEFSGATGQVETKTESGYIFVRQQFYAADGSTYWAEWKRSPGFTGKQYTQNNSANSFLRNENNRWSDWSWLIVLFILVAIWPKLLFIIIPFAGGILLLMLLGWIISAFDKVLPWISALAIMLIVIFGVRSLFHNSDNSAIRSTSNRGVDSVSSERKVVRGQNNQADTLINHILHWKDRDSASYTIQLSVLSSTLNRSAAAHNQMDMQQYNFQGIGAVYRLMLNTDNDYTKPFATAFDSLARLNSMDRLHKASMVVSCIQSIPYTLVVDNSCSSNYSDDYIKQYLAHCENDCCKGYSKFGVQSPIEFIGDLKGDCDTRALFLYDILGKLGYKVALMISNYYKHALIAVCLNKELSNDVASIHINGDRFYLWETTSKGFGPGEIPASISNINYWDIALIQ